MECLRTVKLDRTRTQNKLNAALGRVQQFVDAHPSPLNVEEERSMDEMLARINDPALDDMWSTARQRYVFPTLSK